MSDTPRGTTVVTFPLALLTAAVLIATAAVTFFAMVRGEEETQVPAIIGEDLLAAMTQVQEKGLVARVEGRFTSEVPIWHVVAQTPEAGSLVKAGRPVTVVVSRGRAVPEVGDYLGRDIDQVRMELQTLSATGESPIRIREDGPRITDPRPAGTILGQSPDPGAEVAEGLTILVTVSRGPQGDLPRRATTTMELQKPVAGSDVAGDVHRELTGESPSLFMRERRVLPEGLFPLTRQLRQVRVLFHHQRVPDEIAGRHRDRYTPSLGKLLDLLVDLGIDDNVDPGVP